MEKLRTMAHIIAVQRVLNGATGIEARMKKITNKGEENEWKEISITLGTLLLVSFIINIILLFKWVGLKDYILFNC